MIDRLRVWLLNLLFELLYSQLVLFHEPAGVVVFGAAWRGRRLQCLTGLHDRASVVDLGAGEGRLVAAADRRCLPIRGFDPSPSMRSRARKMGVCVSRGSSYDLPVPTGKTDAIIATYPGRWIFDDRTWREIDRVLSRRGEVRVLLGGTYETGRAAWIRRSIVQLAYGKTGAGNLLLFAESPFGFEVRTCAVADEWGEAIYLVARRRGV